jgi:hypothetical protein
LQWILKHCTEYDRRWQVPSQDKKMEWPFESGEKKLSRLGADPGFQVFSNCGGRRENFWGISCEKSRFYTKKSYFFQLRREVRKFLGYFVWKITILCQKILFLPILGGGAGRVPPTPWRQKSIISLHILVKIKQPFVYTTYLN